ncbi:Methylamine utilisation protein MauE [Sinomicrobium oceani]|uniref:Methylamine utilisation protein MauE n=1 Tax=Sinomicrobium oceani TaxID=1150368 RepID=A0A1K1MCA8_9FLAO|nr:MauE/DoxX family redox-associated membrane protein [Sinomicrobium oceani]SFW20771.1 Methylamine utilisation protein MauE [Sinomicrobium oceani]
MKNAVLMIPRFFVKHRNVIVEIICYLFILLFVYAAVNKLMDVQKFTVQIGQSPLLTNIAGFTAWFIPIIEVIVALMLAWTRTRLAGLYGAFTLMVMFTAYIIAILSFSEKIPCSCGGVLEKLGWTEHLIFNIAFILLALLGIVLSLKQTKKDTTTLSTSEYQFK